MKTVRTYSNLAEAGFASSLLESRGIRAALLDEQTFQLTPGMAAAGIRLQVADEDAERAMQILSTGPPAELRTGEPYSGEMAAERPRPKTSPGLIILGAVFFGVLGYVLHDVAANSRWGRSSGPLTEKFDYNQDGQPDHFFTFHDGYMERGTADRNGDGKIDEWTFHGSNGICLRVELDDDFDGRVDSWFAYKNGVIATSKRDLDFDGHSDWNGLYEDGILYEGEMTPNESRQVIRREIYRHGVFREEWVDEDHDGAFDVKFLYDPFGNRSERLPPR